MQLGQVEVLGQAALLLLLSAGTLSSSSEAVSRPLTGGYRPLTTMPPMWTPTRSRSRAAVSTASLTGVSSGSVTRSTWHRAGSVSSSSTSSAWVRTGPTRTASSRPRALVRNVTAWPAAGASSTMKSASPARSSCFTFPSTRMSLMPGAAVATTSRNPVFAKRLDSRRMPWSSRYSSRAWSGVTVRARTRSASSTSS